MVNNYKDKGKQMKELDSEGLVPTGYRISNDTEVRLSIEMGCAYISTPSSDEVEIDPDLLGLISEACGHLHELWRGDPENSI